MPLCQRLAQVFLYSLLSILPAQAPPQDTTPTVTTDSFDAPSETKTVDFGPSLANLPGTQRVRNTLTCYRYPILMIKQYDEGEKGAAWLGIVPTTKGAASPCARSHAAGEKVIRYPEWTGYFKGAKGNLVFFDAADGTDGGMPFVVYDSKTGKQVFKDSYYDSSMWNEKVEESPFNQMRISNSPNGRISLTYLRVTATDCDLHRAAASCWERVRNRLGVMSTQAPVCSGYKDVTTRWSSSLAYPIEVSLSPQPSVKNVDGPVRCWPVD